MGDCDLEFSRLIGLICSSTDPVQEPLCIHETLLHPFSAP